MDEDKIRCRLAALVEAPQGPPEQDLFQLAIGLF